jgi:hypothetical protein
MAEPDAAFLILKTFEHLHGEYVTRYNSTRDWYAIPRIDRKPLDMPVRYRGVDRDALRPASGTGADTQDRLLAEIRLSELEKDERCFGAFIYSLDDALDVLGYLSMDGFANEYELGWIKKANSKEPAPADFCSLGFEPSYFFPDSDSPFSPSCDCMLFPRWHGTDQEGRLFLPHFQQLNNCGLFPTPQQAKDFLAFYLSFDWTETGDYEIVEVFVREDAL